MVRNENVIVVESYKVDAGIVAAIRAADKILGWGSTRALMFLASPSKGEAVLRREDGPNGVTFAAPGYETEFSFRPTDRGGIKGFGCGGGFIRLTHSYAEANSTGGHWVRLWIDNGELAVETDGQPSMQSWGDCIDADGQFIFRKEEELKAERAARIRAAMKA